MQLSQALEDIGQPTVFISYSHLDESYKNRLRVKLEASKPTKHMNIWDDREIEPTDEWYRSIRLAMAQAAVAICLISENYIRSDFCAKEEIPYLLRRREQDGMMLVFVLVEPCGWKEIPWLEKRQMLPRDGKSISEYAADDDEDPFAPVVEAVGRKLANPGYCPPKVRPAWDRPEKEDISRLPATGAQLFGRQKELHFLDRAWRNHNLHVVSLVAWGGVGKSTLVNTWLENLSQDNYMGSRFVYGWSFHSQGAGQRVTSADEFIAHALQWFGYTGPFPTSPWTRGEILAELIRDQRTLLILDGMEPLQSDRDFDRGCIKDPGLSALVTELMHGQKGMCLITSRERVKELQDAPETTAELSLEQISPEAGRALLRVKGVRGNDADLEATAIRFGNQALALSLLGAYLYDIPGHPVTEATTISELDIPVEAGRHSKSVMAAFERRFGEGPELQLLRILGLFDRAAEDAWIQAVLAPPAIESLTSDLQGLSDGEWLRLLERLRRTGLLAPQSRHCREIIDTHPLVREFFGQRLRENIVSAWQEGHSRLFEFFEHATDELPENLERMVPLYMAVSHACRAGRAVEALENVFVPRIRRGHIHFSIHQLGVLGSELSALAGFFKQPWIDIDADLDPSSQGYIQHETAACLQATGNLPEAFELIRSGYDTALSLSNWPNAALSASRLSSICLVRGDIDPAALEWAGRGAYLAQQTSAELAARGWVFFPMENFSMLAHVLGVLGRWEEAEQWFEAAEQEQKELQPEYPQLLSIKGFRYCQFLLVRGMCDEVKRRASRSVEWHRSQGWILDIALDHLSLGQAEMLSGGGDRARAAAHLNAAVDTIRKSGYLDFLPVALIARASLSRRCNDGDRALRDLETAMKIIQRTGMRLFEADGLLEHAHIAIARGDISGGRAHFQTAQSMIGQMGCRHRDKELSELRGLLGL